MFDNLLISILAFPLVGVFVLLFVPSNKQKLLKLIALNISSLPFIGSLFLWAYFKKSFGYFQFVTKLDGLSSLNLKMTLEIDGISLFFILLTTLLIPICILLSWDIFYIVPVSFFFIPNPWQIIFESVYEVVSQWLVGRVSTASGKYFPFFTTTSQVSSINLCSVPQAMTPEGYSALCLSMEEKHGQKMDEFIYCPPYPGNLTLVELSAWIDAWTVRGDNYSTTVSDQTNTYVEDPTCLFAESIGLTDPSQVVAAYRIYRTFGPCANFMWNFREAMLMAKFIKFRQPSLVQLTQEEYWGIVRPLTKNNPSEIPLKNHFTETGFTDFLPWGNYADYKTEFSSSGIFPRIEGYLERSSYETSQGRRLLRNRLVKAIDEQQNPCPTLREMSPETFNYDEMTSLTRASINLFPHILGEDSIC